jgi:hypothetical protein
MYVYYNKHTKIIIIIQIYLLYALHYYNLKHKIIKI